MESRIFRQGYGFSRECREFLFAIRPAGGDEFPNLPVEVGASRDDVAATYSEQAKSVVSYSDAASVLFCGIEITIFSPQTCGDDFDSCLKLLLEQITPRCVPWSAIPSKGSTVGKNPIVARSKWDRLVLA